ncbi:MAG: hypothetical protein HC840_22515 [Leptolyngbyaceae cyanobacterium RM2_2_4]|nr:hypothetical protein [Leptolyngbyaceae cyanobacterium RM2_2_4]
MGTLFIRKSLTQALYERIEEAERMLPLSGEEEASAPSPKSGVETDALDHFPKRTFTTPGLQE